MYIERKINIPHTSFFLFGPRGTGKTMMLKKRFPDALYIDLVNSGEYQKFLTHPEYLIEIATPLPNGSTIIIDEIQKIPALLDGVHFLIEQKREFIFILTGSNARKLKRNETNLLAGRAIKINMNTFTYDELYNQNIVKPIEEILKYGLIPIVIDSDYPKEVLHSYIGLYLKEEILQEGLTRNINSFSRFLEAISFSHSSLLNVSEIARDCSVPRKTVEGYVEILEELLIAYRIPVFTKRSKRRLVNHRKFYFFDSGLFQTIRPKGPLDSLSEINGAALEGLVLQHIRSAIENPSSKIYFYRTSSGTEVDFIIYGENIFTAIEVKNGDKIRPGDLKSLKSFFIDYPECKPILVYRGKDTLIKDGILIVPIENFLINIETIIKLEKK